MADCDHSLIDAVIQVLVISVSSRDRALRPKNGRSAPAETSQPALPEADCRLEFG